MTNSLRKTLKVVLPNKWTNHISCKLQSVSFPSYEINFKDETILHDFMRAENN